MLFATDGPAAIERQNRQHHAARTVASLEQSRARVRAVAEELTQYEHMLDTQTAQSIADEERNMLALMDGQAAREAVRLADEADLTAKVNQARVRREHLQETLSRATSSLSGDIIAVDDLIQARLREQEMTGSSDSALASWMRMDEICVHSQQRIIRSLQELTNHTAAS